MSSLVTVILIIVGASLLLIALILKGFRMRLASRACVLIASALLIAYSSQYLASIFQAFKNGDVSYLDIGNLCLFIFAILLTIYELSTFVRNRR